MVCMYVCVFVCYTTIWPITPYRVVSHTLEGHESTVWSIAFDNTGSKLGGLQINRNVPINQQKY